MKTPTWLLERFAQGELDAGETVRLRARLAAEGRSLEAEVAALAQSNQDILAEHPRQAMAAAIRQRAARTAATTTTTAAKSSKTWMNGWIAPLALAGSMGLVLLMVRGGHHPATHPAPTAAQQPDELESTRDKGPPRLTPRLVVYRQRVGGDGQPERLGDGARAARGDLLQLAYAARDGLYGVLLSIDGAGRVTQHLPDEGTSWSARLRPAREIRLSSSYELDDAPGFERFVLVTATEPFPVAMALDAARALAADGAHAQSLSLGLAPSFQQTSVLLHKTSKGSP